MTTFGVMRLLRSLPMIVFGTKSVSRVVPQGRRETRVCGKCQMLTELVEHRIRRYFTLYFVPLIAISAAESVMQCERCESMYHLTASDYASAATPHAAPGSDTVSCPCCQQVLRVPNTSTGALKLRCQACRGEFSIERNRA